MADIFVSYTKSDQAAAHWLGQKLAALGHTPHLHEWEIRSGENFYAWMRERLDAADHALCVISDEYLRAPHSIWEFDAAVRQAADKRPGFLLPVVVNLRQLKVPVIIDHLNRCELQGLSDQAMRAGFQEFVRRLDTPGTAAKPLAPTTALSNVPVRVPPHFIGRDDTLIDIDRVLRRGDARVAITALHGLRGVGKTVLAAAYAELHRGDFRATWWVRAETEPSLRADLAALGVRLGWVAADETEAAALAAIGERLRHEGDGILLIFDNAVDADALLPYLPRGGAARVLVTSNAYAWRGLAEPVEIRVWPKEIGADFLVARTGRGAERKAAEDLSEALGGLPLAHEQAAAYCERLEIPLAEYARRFAAMPARLLDAGHDAPAEYHDRLTVAKTFALAIDEAAKLHPAAEMLIVHAALLAPEPIPLFLFAEVGEKFGERLAALLADDGLDEAVAALRAFALVDRETIEDERDPAISTDTIRLHRLVREVAASRCDGEAREEMRRALVEALAAIYPQGVFEDPKTWPRARRLDALALTLVGGDAALPDGAAMPASHLLDRLGSYRQGALGAYASARPLFERALAIRESALGPDHLNTAQSLNNLAFLLQA